MSGTTTSLYPDSLQQARIYSMFPGCHFRYLPGLEKPDGTVDVYGIINGDPNDPEDVRKLEQLRNEIGDLYIILVLGDPDWAPPR